MAQERLHNKNIVSQKLLPTPAEVSASLPLTESAVETVRRGREGIKGILERRDKRLLAVVGPCSVHDLQAAREYAGRLHKLAQKVQDTFFVVMRVYFEKPRTVRGWKGFINDPYLDDSFRIDEGLYKAREFLLEIAELGLPAGTEALDPLTPQYLADLVSWTAIGARTTESQTHRELASGLSMPVGIKNGTDGSREVAINALQSVSSSHHFLGYSFDGQAAVFHTNGNPYAHIVLRGGRRPNYDSVSIASCEGELEEAGLPKNIMVDCSHGNSRKEPVRQVLVLQDIVNQMVNRNSSIAGFMLESNLRGGKQSLISGGENLEYGVSITDACLSWEETEEALLEAAEKVAPVLGARINTTS